MKEIFENWNKLKQKIHEKSLKNVYFKEWDIWWSSLWQNIKSEANWKWEFFMRPILIIKKLSSDSCIAIPLSTKEKKMNLVLFLWFTLTKIYSFIIPNKNDS